MNWTLEDQVDDWLKKQLNDDGIPYTVESNMSEYMKDSLKGGAKTIKKTNFGKPDFQIERYKIPVIFENKLHIKKLKNKVKSGIKDDAKSISNYAVNGALYYARTMIKSGKYNDGVVAIGLAGDSPKNVKMEVYYVYGSQSTPKFMKNYTNVDFMENERSFNDFLSNARLTDEEKHQILIKTTQDLNKQAKKLNVLMNNLNITAGSRVIYVSGSLLAMQDIYSNDSIDKGLVPSDLVGSQLSGSKDGDRIVLRISQFLRYRNIPQEKVDLMMHSFGDIKSDPDREVPIELKKQVSKLIDGRASVDKQIFTFIYENVFKSIDGTAGHLDIMGTMYSEFLKYALGDGKGIGIVLTPPYITKMMTNILGVNKDSHVMDLATGSAGFLISSMTTMIDDANKTYGRNTSQAQKKIKNIKSKQLLGVELNPQMFTLAATNMILRGDGSSQIKKGDSFHLSNPNLYKEFQPDKLLLNPPFSFHENGMPFVEYGMRYMKKGGKAAIIVQDSAGSGKAVETNKQILKHNTLMCSIKMPIDLFEPSAGVQTSIYVFSTGEPHDYDKTVRFIDFRNDGYKRTGRGINEVDHPLEKYKDILKIVKAGRNAKLGKDSTLWNLDQQVFDDQIDKSGADWNFEQHQIIDTVPSKEDFVRTVGNYLSWELNQVIKRGI